MTKYDTTKKTTTEELTCEGFEIYKANGNKTWYVMKNGLAYAGFRTKAMAIDAMLGYVEMGC